MRRLGIALMIGLASLATQVVGAAEPERQSHPYVAGGPNFACAAPVAGACFRISGSPSTAVITIDDAIGEHLRGTYRFDSSEEFVGFCGSATVTLPANTKNLYVFVGGKANIDCGPQDVATTGSITADFS